MLNIYYGRDSIDKEKFIFDKVKISGYSSQKPVIIIVPDQYTLEAERQAFKYLRTKSLLGLDIFSMSRLAHNILAEMGSGRQTFIDNYGRQMLLNRIGREVNTELQVYTGRMKDTSFLEIVNNFISTLKHFGISGEKLSEIEQELENNTLLSKKISDISRIYNRYNQEISGKYTDSEDYIELFLDRIGESETIKKSEIWIYGFDSFAPRYLKLIQGFMGAALNVNVVLTFDKNSKDEELFHITGRLINTLQNMAVEGGCTLGDNLKIPNDYLRERFIKGIPGSPLSPSFSRRAR